ncbi:HIT family protein [Sphingomonas crusticola]|uniref:HIT family protein n=1 Tax=Sphingomonas crusticola TaxID=1697973 RepID=UPI0019684A62|nr:HIT family protein [Sphingomonas crusticola]
MRIWILGVAATLALTGCTGAPLNSIPLTGTYDPTNIFAKIIRGEAKSVKVYETDRVLAFMDHAPASPGHVLVISKVSHARTLLEMHPQDYDEVMAAVRKVALAEVKALDLKGFTIIENNGLGQSVPHLHVHIIPRYGRIRIKETAAPIASDAQLEVIAAKIRAVLATMP